MTEKEVQELVDAALDKRLASLTTQFGRDLSERYATKDEVDAAVKEGINAVVKGFEGAVDQLLNDANSSDFDDPDHPLAFLIQFFNELTDLRMRMIEIGIYILCKEAKVERGPDAMDRFFKITRVQAAALQRARSHLREDADHMRKHIGPESDFSAMEDVLELLAKEPEDAKTRRAN